MVRREASPSRRLRRVHRLDLDMRVVESLQGADGKQLAVHAQRVELDVVVGEGVCVEGVAILSGYV